MFAKPTIALPGRRSARLIDFGSAWYARWANESPSIASSGWPVVRATDGSVGADAGARVATEKTRPRFVTGIPGNLFPDRLAFLCRFVYRAVN
jgi:hypothetical protein